MREGTGRGRGQRSGGRARPRAHAHTHPHHYHRRHTQAHEAQGGGAVGRHSRVFIVVGRAGAQGASSTSSLCMYEFSQWRRSRAASSRARSRKAASSASARLRRDSGVAGSARAPPGVRSLPGDGMRRLPWVPARHQPPAACSPRGLTRSPVTAPAAEGLGLCRPVSCSVWVFGSVFTRFRAS